ncbi:glucoamylase [Deinococcus malanensis]|uniref:Glucoamylase n=1 Tax=Deinococcus malanensis TaxID=1706855 RepID=A0ABQ2F084_9DEIO|nr:glycoside hydrolase family 15 protein [Deinococcus malanensis]GGK33956.1 glucoamylase [Deinococcus malanensis]
MTHLPLEHYGVIGDMHTAALVGANGSLDWLCYPHFDSPSVFAAMLDSEVGGRFQIAPVAEMTSRQLYLPDSNVLVTRFQGGGGLAEVTDFMPVPPGPVTSGPGVHAPSVIRRVRVLSGHVAWRWTCHPAFDYARAPHEVLLEEGAAVFRTPALSLRLTTSVPLELQGAAAGGTFSLRAGEEAHFLFQDARVPTPPDLTGLERGTLHFWRTWLAQCTYQGRWQETVRRSALTLKLLTFGPTGAIVAAPTTSLPEWTGGTRNWDYRYTWLRDAAFTVYALMRLGFHTEAGAFVDFIEARSRESSPDGSLRVMYRINGGTDIREEKLEHLAGYRGSRPVRVGNAAYGQFQLDVYGELIDAIYLYNKHGEPISHDVWITVTRMLDWLCSHWRDHDDGIWEVRGGQRPFVLSKVMCWVAFDRGLRMAAQRGLPAPVDRWRAERDAVYEEVMREGYNEEVGAFTQVYGASEPDGANLLLPLVKFVGPREPRMLTTLELTRTQLTSGPLVYRYRPEHAASDGVGGEEGAFLPCSFWLAECLARAGQLEEARTLFEQTLTFTTPLGLLSEEIGPDGQALGNFPQALSHLALISAAVNLDRALDA